MKLAIPNFIYRLLSRAKSAAAAQDVDPKMARLIELQFDADGWDHTEDTGLCARLDEIIAEDEPEPASPARKVARP